jgi:adenylate kinase family enzyme
MDRDLLSRVAIVGTSGAGKTTLARSLGRALGVRHIELDALYWGPSWTPTPREEFRSRALEAVGASRWVVDGNYSAVRDIVWGRATTLVWLDYSFQLVFRRAVWRTIRRTVTREQLYAGNRESLRAIADADWIPWWVLRTFWKRRREYPGLLQKPEFAHLQVLQLGHPREGVRLLEACAA